MLKIWGRLNSSNVKKVLWTCAELGIPYERVDAGLHFGVNNTDEFKAMNPMAMIPVIDDDGFVLWESNPIVRYLCAKHPKAPYWPENLQTRAAADRWMEFQSTTMSPSEKTQTTRVGPSAAFSQRCGSVASKWIVSPGRRSCT